MAIGKELHVAMVTSPGTGHLTASLELANRLVSTHNIQVSFFTTTTPTTLTSRSTPTTPPGLHLVNLPPVDISSIAPADADLLTRISIIVRHSLPSLQSRILSSPLPRPTVMVVDEFSTDAFEAAEALDMKMYLLITMNATESAFMSYLPNLDHQIKIDHRQLNGTLLVPGLKPLPIEELNDSFQDRESQSYNSVLKHTKRFYKASGILVNTFQELEPETLTSLYRDDIKRMIPIPRVYPVGPLINTKNRPISPKQENQNPKQQHHYLTWLNKQPADSVVYVSFGSGGTMRSEQITELAWGLELSQQRFIWVVRPPQEKVASGAYFNGGNGLNDPKDYLPEGFLERTKETGLVVPNWAAQIEILSHGSVGGFLSHCGWNSTLESIVNGVPLIALPLFAEQRLNAWMMVEEAKVGVRSAVTPRDGVVGRDEIERMVRLVMEEEKGKRFRSRARELKECAIRSVEEGGSSYNSLSELVGKWKCDSKVVHFPG